MANTHVSNARQTKDIIITVFISYVYMLFY